MVVGDKRPSWQSCKRIEILKFLITMIFWKRVQQAINKLWYPRSVTIGIPVETQELAERIARESTVAPADTHAVIRALSDVMADFMKESRAVHLEGIGWFRYTTVSAGKGVATKEEVSSTQITGLRVQFTPDRARNMSGGYNRSLIPDSGVVYMEWLGRDSDETQLPEAEQAIQSGRDGATGAENSTGTRGGEYILKGEGILVLGADGESEGKLILRNDLGTPCVVDEISTNTENLVIFTIPINLTEGKYKLEIETYYSPGGTREEPIILIAPFELSLE